MSRSRVVASLLLLGTLLLYLPATHYSFTLYDDGLYVYENAHVQDGLTGESFRWAFTTFQGGNWHPLTWLSLMLDCQLFDMNAGVHHTVNVLFHAANTVLLFALLLRLVKTFWPCALIAALFAWHPLRVESVAWISERKDVLGAFFALLSLLCYVHYAQKCEGRSGKDENRQPILNSQLSTLNYFLALFFFACALMAKPMFVTLPFVLLLLDYWPLNRARNAEGGVRNGLKSVGEKIPFFILSAALAAITLVAQHREGAIVSLQKVTWLYRLENAPLAMARYLWKTIWPMDLSVLYPLNVIQPGAVAVSLLVLILVSTVTWTRRRSRPCLIVGWLWFIGMLVPVSGLVQAGSAAMADRYTYFPSIGLFLALVPAADDLLARLPARHIITCVTGGLVLAACFGLTRRQLGYWHDDITLFSHAVAVTKNNDTAHINLGFALEKGGSKREAMDEYRLALKINPASIEAHNNLANLLDDTGHPDDAIAEYQEALRLDPRYVPARNNLGTVFVERGQYDDALKLYMEAARLDPDDWHAPFLTGKVLLKQGRDREAVPFFQSALRLSPQNLSALTFVARVLAADETPQVRDGKTAYQLAEKANALAGGSQPAMLDTLAMAYAELGLFDDAQRTQQSALDIATRFGATNDIPEIQQRLELYRDHRPFRQSFVHQPDDKNHAQRPTPP